ncbi:hypothetical protein LTR91_010525 [Friedmanniomyces endolithicus]|uniref:Rhodopsin domain-containing protein n=1 Tax=Friedmanniomyces endolithicus TaxID=329885 RepID=A0AAN6FPA2_9PEZI|nr:hypothetical protein LTS09_011024 [Friedmanniomyces endolithicus]KAK0312633.1 hypothetical protein LTR01_002292 [Friedmanniomyces endolithicus]KAK0322036.1 hypothetical protein LTR82_007010 [Friedmanniomyces endolithicus]KAK0827348.1 hypothetical protein LTR73_005584 [Friedmanniomyces endolithicus]KAK0930766.1 hypothetical protein LTR57_001147 [Friedmanniomyces endolithicus]
MSTTAATAELPVHHTLQEAQHRANTLTAVAATFLAIAWFTVSLRLWVRGLLIRSIGWDDWAMVATNVIYTVYCATAFILNDYNPELMLGLLPLDEYGEVFSYLLATIALYITTTVAIKIALGLFFLRIMVEKWQRRVIYATVGFSSLYGLAFLFFGIFQCGNPTGYLIHSLQGDCVSRESLLSVNITAGVINALADWILATLPIFLLRKVQIPLPAKISAGCLMVLGSVGSISSMVRLVYVHDFLPGPDFFWSSVNLTTWSIIECGLCITAASLATLRPLFRCCMENVHTLTPSLGGDSSLGGRRRAGTSESIETATWTGQLHVKNDLLLPDWNRQQKSGKTLDPRIAQSGLDGHPGPGESTKRPEAERRGHGKLTEFPSTAHVQQNEAAWSQYRRLEAGRKAKTLELERIAKQAKPNNAHLQFDGALPPYHPGESNQNPRRVLASKYFSGAPEWV